MFSQLPPTDTQSIKDKKLKKKKKVDRVILSMRDPIQTALTIWISIQGIKPS